MLSVTFGACGPAPEPTVEFPVVVIETATAAAEPVELDEPPELPDPADEVLADGQLWRGRYLCAQGWTELELAIVTVERGQAEAIFAFHHRSSGAKGSYRMKGSYDSFTRRLSLQAGEWIERPSGYVTVGMTGKVDASKRTYTGQIDHPSCGAFELKRVAPLDFQF